MIKESSTGRLEHEKSQLWKSKLDVANEIGLPSSADQHTIMSIYQDDHYYRRSLQHIFIFIVWVVLRAMPYMSSSRERDYNGSYGCWRVLHSFRSLKK